MADSDTAQQAFINARAALQSEIRAIFEKSLRGAAIETEIEAILRKAIAKVKTRRNYTPFIAFFVVGFIAGLFL